MGKPDEDETGCFFCSGSPVIGGLGLPAKFPETFPPRGTPSVWRPTMPFLAARIFALLLAPCTFFLPSTFLSACRAAPPAAQNIFQDIFAGSGTPDPFALSWNNVQLYTETVIVNQQTQLRPAQ